MKQNAWIILFVIVLIGELVGVQLKNELLQLIFKPLIIPVLIAYFNFNINITKGIMRLVFLALLFSLAGDVLLMFQGKDSMFFLLGLSAFLIAHIFYIIFFYTIRSREQIKTKPLLLFIAAIYYAALISWLFPYLGTMKIPVCVYGIVISAMFMLAMHLLFVKNKMAGTRIMIGASLFVISDSVLAINKFYRSFEPANLVIMLSYALAQFFIINGVVRYMAPKEY